MNDTLPRGVERPSVRPADPRFSSGPCRKHPGWSSDRLSTALLGRSHRAADPKARLKAAIDRSAALLELPDDWKLGIVPGSDTGAFEMAMWSLLGPRPVDALVWESFSSDWAKDLKALELDRLAVHEADYGALPDLATVDDGHDVVFVYNGTTSGVCLPDLDWLSADREGLALCDATSAAFAVPIDFSRLDVVTWSWQKVLGGEGAHGMIALGPRAQARLVDTPRPRPLPKLFTLARNGRLIDGIFAGETINTPSLLCIEDLHSALDWAESIGGLAALHERTEANFRTLDTWVSATDGVRWLAADPLTRSPTSMCVSVDADWFLALDEAARQPCIKEMVGWLAEEGVAYDIAHYRNAPPGFRIWGGATVDADDIAALTPWIDWALARARQAQPSQENARD